MEQFIKATPQNKKDLMAEFDTSLETVSRALNFETYSYLAKQIRTRALQMGCKLMMETPKEGAVVVTLIHQGTTPERKVQ
jgi:hypothetical protein